MIHLFPTYSCNLNCPYCYVNSKDIYTDPHTEFNDKVFKVVVSIVNSINPEVIHIEGGEPLLYSKIFKLISKIKNKNVLNLITNGILIDEKIIKKIKLAGLKKITLSLDGATSATNSILRKKSFNATIKGLQLLRKNNFCISLSFTVTKQNLKDIKNENLINLAINMGVNELRIGTLLLAGRGTKAKILLLTTIEYIELIEKYLVLKQKFNNKIRITLSLPGFLLDTIQRSYLKDSFSKFIPCDAGKTQVAIGPSGELYPCYNLVNRKEFIIGNIIKQNISTVLNNPKVRKLHENKKFCPVMCFGHIYYW